MPYVEGEYLSARMQREKTCSGVQSEVLGVGVWMRGVSRAPGGLSPPLDSGAVETHYTM